MGTGQVSISLHLLFMKPSLPKISYLKRCSSTHCSQAVTLAFTLAIERAACLRVQTAILAEFAFKPLLLHTLLQPCESKTPPPTYWKLFLFD